MAKRTNIYAPKKTKYVVIKKDQKKWSYFFRTSIPKTLVTDLGQKDANSIPEDLTDPAIIGTRTPSPLRMRHKGSGVSSFCATASYKKAIAKGWRRSKNSSFMASRTQIVTPSSYTENDKGSVLCTVETASVGGNIRFGWYMPVQQLRRLTAEDISGLGLNFPTTEAEWAEVVRGSDTPRPPRASKIETTNSSGLFDKITTFYADDQTLPNGWSHETDAIPFSI